MAVRLAGHFAPLKRSGISTEPQDIFRLDTTLCKPVGDAANFLDGPADQILMLLVLGLFGGVASSARYRITAIIAKASMTRERAQLIRVRASASQNGLLA